MKKNYQNDLLGWSKEEIKKEWGNVWEKIQSLNPLKDITELVELNKRFDKCEEAYYAIDCGDHWEVESASNLRKGMKGVPYKVMKES